MEALWCATRQHPLCPALQVALSEDVSGAANKLIILKTMFPKADVFSIMATRPKTLLQSEERITESARQVSRGPSVCSSWLTCASVLFRLALEMREWRGHRPEGESKAECWPCIFSKGCKLVRCESLAVSQ